MPFTTKDMLCGVVAPVIVAAVVLIFARRWLTGGGENRHASSWATMIGFLVGYGLLSLAPWSPTAHWHWLPHAFLVAAIVGPVAAVDGVTFFERVCLYLLVALAAGWVLVPDWADLAPSRNVHIVMFTAYVVLSSILLDQLAKRIEGPAVPIVLWCTLTAAAIVLALSGSLRFAQIAIALGSALFGIVLVASFRRDAVHLNGIALLFSVAAIGSLLVGRVNSFSEVPLASYLLIPAAPICAWCGSMGPFRDLTGAKKVAAVTTLPMVLLAAAVTIAVIAEFSGGSGY